MRKLLDPDHLELSQILDDLLREDIEISAREIARRHTSIRHASAFTRKADRQKLIDTAQTRQKDARNVVTAPIQTKAKSLAETLADRDLKVAELEGQIKALIASHSACVKAVMVHGGMPALRRFWVDYKVIGDEMAALGAIPKGADVVELRPRGK